MISVEQKKQQLLNTQFHNIKSHSDPLLQRTIDMLNAKCLLLWLTALPIQEQSFHLNKQEFQDALLLRYGWELSRVPSHYVCGATFTANHAMICRHGGLTFIRHNELRDLTASWLHEYAMIWLLSFLYNHSMVRLLFLHLLITETMLRQILCQRFLG